MRLNFFSCDERITRTHLVYQENSETRTSEKSKNYGRQIFFIKQVNKDERRAKKRRLNKPSEFKISNGRYLM